MEVAIKSRGQCCLLRQCRCLRKIHTKNTTVQASTNCSDSTASNINLLEMYRRTKRKSTPISYWENLKENQQHVTFKTNWVSTNTAPRLHLYTNIQKVSGKRRGTSRHDKPGQHYPR
jgi:type II secretory pathway component HofQ